MKKIRIILYQKSLGIPITRKDVMEMKEYSPHFVCFPEYFFINRRLGNTAQTAHNQAWQIKRVELLSKTLDTVIIGGSMPELADGVVYNTTYIYQSGRKLGSYRKKNLFYTEFDKITPGKEYRTFDAYGITFGVLICADVFHDESFLFMEKNHAGIIFSPTFSLYKEETIQEKFKRDADIYVRGARLSGAVIIKVCGVRSDYRTYLQARSLIADSSDVLYRVMPEEEHTEMIIKREITINE